VGRVWSTPIGYRSPSSAPTLAPVAYSTMAIGQKAATPMAEIFPMQDPSLHLYRLPRRTGPRFRPGRRRPFRMPRADGSNFVDGDIGFFHTIQRLLGLAELGRGDSRCESSVTRAVPVNRPASQVWETRGAPIPMIHKKSFGFGEQPDIKPGHVPTHRGFGPGCSG